MKNFKSNCWSHAVTIKGIMLTFNIYFAWKRRTKKWGEDFDFRNKNRIRYFYTNLTNM